MTARKHGYEAAMHDFRRARQRGALESLITQLRGRSPELLRYGDVSEQLKAGEPLGRSLEMAPLDAIVGSVGRYSDFTRTFLPRRKGDEERWARVRAAFDSVEEMPPILLYKLGDSYFVLDGNHRVSVARVLGATHIPAYVTEVEIKVPLPPDVEPDEVITRAKYVDFVEETNLHEVRPEADLTVTEPGQYRVLRQQIDDYQRWMEQERGEAVPLEEAVADWYDNMYEPLVQVIRRRGLLRYFPGRTETDLYTWVCRHRDELEEEIGWEVDSTLAARDLVQRHSPTPGQMLRRVRQRVLNALTPEPLEPGPPPGEWREVVLGAGHEANLFAQILAPVPGTEEGWYGLEQALLVAQWEEGRVNGLHVVSDGERSARRIEALQKEFERRCAEAGVEGRLTVEEGPVARTICERAYWNDLVMLPLSHPPGPKAAHRLGSGVSTLIRACGRPVLAVPGMVSPLKRPLLAFDGSPKAREALFVAAYLAGKWRLPLSVVTIADEGAADAQVADARAGEALTLARQYLQSRRVGAFYMVEHGPVAETLRRVAREQESDLIIMGGYGFRPLLDVMLGSTVNDVLWWREWVVLVCR